MLSKLINVGVLVLATSLGCPGTIPARGAERVANISLSGCDWRIHEDADGKGAERGMPVADVVAPGWIPATVPGNIQADLETGRLIPPFWYRSDDPLLAEAPKSGTSITWAEMWNRSDFTGPGGDPRLADVARKDWWYRKDFTVPQSFEGKRVRLVFDGVDHECEVYLNGNKIGGHGGMYRQVGYDIGSSLRPGQVNHLGVKIARMPPSLERHIGMPSQIKAYRHELSEIKCPSYGLDWGIGVYSLGIWKDVRVEASGPARIDDVHVQTKLDQAYRKARVIARLEVDSQKQLEAKVRFRIEGHGANLSTEVGIKLSEGINKIEAALDLDQPALWWPNGQGTQPLYQLISELVDAEGSVLHSRMTRFGVREIRWAQVENAPHDASVLSQLVVNGRKVRLLGTNIIPVDSLPGRQHAKADWLLRMAHAARMNVVRLWGGGVTMREEWYDLADELGMMIQQEMPTTNSGESWPEEYSAYTAAMERTAVSIIRQFRNHPSIFEWTGGNEMGWPGNDSPIPTLLRKLVAEMDDRIFRVTDPEPGWAHGPYNATPDQFYRSYNAPPATRRDEFGAPGPAHLETWHRDIPPASQWPLRSDDPVLVVKNVIYGWLGNTWLQPHVIENQFGRLPDLASLIKAGQWISADELRYAMDAMRRGGLGTSGFMNWVFNEPWSNGAGNTVVDYDGRPLMNYDFAAQALTPVSLSLKYDSLLYDPVTGVSAQLFLVSDAPERLRSLRWHWRARDRHGKVFSQGSGVADSIEPQGVIPLEPVTLRPPPQTALGPVFVELGLEDAEGRTLMGRLHLFGATALQAPLAGLLVNGVPDPDDATAELPGPRSPQNLAWVGNGAAQATASAELPGYEIHRAKGLNDGVYGNAQSWIGGVAGASFQIELGRETEIGRFRLGRDRTGGYADRTLGELKIETSADGQAWRTVFERQGLSALPGYRPIATMEIHVAPCRAKWVRATVNPANVCLDEFEVYPADGSAGELPRIVFPGGLAPRPVTRTAIQAEARPVRLEGDQEVLDLVLRNAGPMTALFCEARPLIEYRTDLFIRNNHVSIPPGESRTIVIRSAAHPDGGLSLAQTGWRINAWNADERVIEPASSVLLALGRRDAMCREFDGYLNSGRIAGAARVRVEGTRPDPARLPYLLDGKGARFEFPASEAQARHPARLRIHTADQSADTPTKALATINGRRLEGTLPRGLGIQRTDPAHLAFPATVEFRIPARDLRTGKNTLEVDLQGDGWFTWDAMDLTSVLEGSSHGP